MCNFMCLMYIFIEFMIPSHEIAGSSCMFNVLHQFFNTFWSVGALNSVSEKF